MESTNIYIVYQNTDLTEGRGHSFPIHFCRINATATRLAQGKGVMGSSADIVAAPIVEIEGREYISIAFLRLTPPSAQDMQEDHANKQREEIRQKALAAGLTEHEIKLLSK